MQEISHDPMVISIATQISAIGTAGLAAGTAASAMVTALAPAGADEVSIQATSAFMVEGAKALAMNSAALQELIKASGAIMKIANMYEAVDGAAATALESSAMQLASTTMRAAQSAALAESSAASQLAQLAASASPIMQQGMQIAQSVQSSVSGMSGGAGASGMSPSSPPPARVMQTAMDTERPKEDNEAEEQPTVPGAEAGATGGPLTGSAAPVGAPRHAKPETAAPTETDL